MSCNDCRDCPGINKYSPAPLPPLCRIRVQRSLPQPTAVSVSSLRILSSGGTSSLSLQTYAAHTCYRSPSSPTLCLICHSAWKGCFSPPTGPRCQPSLAHCFHLQTCYLCVYPILLLMLSLTSPRLSCHTSPNPVLNRTHRHGVCKKPGSYRAGSGLSLWPTSSHYFPTFPSVLCISCFIPRQKALWSRVWFSCFVYNN